MRHVPGSSIAAFALLCALFVPASASAYIDLGTGSFVAQALIAGFVASLFYVRSAWHRIKSFLPTRLFHRSKPSDTQE